MHRVSKTTFVVPLIAEQSVKRVSSKCFIKMSGRNKATRTSKKKKGGKKKCGSAPSSELKKLQSANSRLKAALDFVIAEADRKNELYEFLVWAGRKTPEEYSKLAAPEIEKLKQSLGEGIEKIIEKELEDLRSEEAGSWQHGFNSAVLSASRQFFLLAKATQDIDWGDARFPSTELKRLQSENRRLTKALDVVVAEALKKNEFHEFMVWAARRTEEEYARYAVPSVAKLKQAFGEGIEKKIERELDNVNSEEGGSWYHGFNNGIMASSRLFLELAAATHDIDLGDIDDPFIQTPEDQRAQAVEKFPSLDT